MTEGMLLSLKKLVRILVDLKTYLNLYCCMVNIVLITLVTKLTNMKFLTIYLLQVYNLQITKASIPSLRTQFLFFKLYSPEVSPLAHIFC